MLSGGLAPGSVGGGGGAGVVVREKEGDRVQEKAL